jgi:hypothetical protein
MALFFIQEGNYQVFGGPQSALYTLLERPSVTPRAKQVGSGKFRQPHRLSGPFYVDGGFF